MVPANMAISMMLRDAARPCAATCPLRDLLESEIFRYRPSTRSHESIIPQSSFICWIMEASQSGFSMSRVRIKTGLTAPDGSEEELTEYLCDYPNCPNFATRMVGCLVELRLMAAVCEAHASMLRLD